MKKTPITTFLLSISAFTHADTENAKIAYQKAIAFGEAVYCQANPLVENDPLKNVFLIDKDQENGMEDYAVIYYGDCSGGSGSYSAKLTPVYFSGSLTYNGYITIDKEADYDLFTLATEINPRFIEKMTQKSTGIVTIISSEFSENDPNSFPSKKFEYEVKLPEMQILKKTQIK
ncbi:Uncharacterised protein [Actinobacillus lignieresii]|uniref:hypothetical protein n=1 Tax=Actinobacillus lignieresii TaxID=720 RepID=UPI000F6BBF8D|nr:hypothetical protein [Actinobacillus lignieresii]VEB26734.1 Uncharacterised protein [Actinobacillus lignieresii]